MYSTLLLDISGAVATITLNRPDKRNAISATMMAELQTALDDIEKSHARVAILTGAGTAFCSGMDLEMLAAIAGQSPAENQEDSRRMAKMFRRIWSFPRPTIAAVNGAALAGGSRGEVWLYGSQNRIFAGPSLRFSDSSNRREAHPGPAAHRADHGSGG